VGEHLEEEEYKARQRLEGVEEQASVAIRVEGTLAF
jgi:hypothetical protein